MALSRWGSRCGHQDVGHAEIGEEVLKEGGEGFKTAGGGADADDGEGICSAWELRFPRGNQEARILRRELVPVLGEVIDGPAFRERSEKGCGHAKGVRHCPDYSRCRNSNNCKDCRGESTRGFHEGRRAPRRSASSSRGLEFMMQAQQGGTQLPLPARDCWCGGCGRSGSGR